MRTLEQIDDFYRAHGYIRMSEPEAGKEPEYLEFHQQGVANIERALAANAKRYRVRGLSKRALAMIHLDLPNPVWGVETTT